MGQSTWGVIVCQIHRRIPQSRVASLFSSSSIIGHYICCSNVERERLLRQMLCPEEREKGNVDEDVGQWLGNDFSLLAVVISCLKVCKLGLVPRILIIRKNMKDNRIKEEMEEEIVCKLWTQEPE